MDKVYGILVLAKYQGGGVQLGGMMSVYATKEEAIKNAQYNLNTKDSSNSKEVIVVELPVVFREFKSYL